MGSHQPHDARRGPAGSTSQAEGSDG